MPVRPVDDMSQHPDIVELRARYDQAAQTAPATTSTIWSNVVTGAVAAVFGIAATTIGMLSRR
jgi:hypothetical protein